MLLLQDRLLRDPEVGGQRMPTAIRVRLAEDLKATRARLEKLTGAKVQLLPQAVTHLRRFLPPEEGGNDKGVAFLVRQIPGYSTPDDPAGGTIPRVNLYHLRAVPWQAFPNELRDPRQLPYNIGLGRHLREHFARPFERSMRDPAAPRMQMLRGKLGPTSSIPAQLSVELDTCRGVRARADQYPDLDGQVREWLVQKAIPAYAAALRDNPKIDDATLRARVGGVWGSAAGSAIDLRMLKAVADPREAQALFQLALFKHEQAVRQQLRADLVRAGGGAADAEDQKAARAWAAAAEHWSDYADGHADQPGIVAARRLWAEALARAGKTEEARRALLLTAPGMTDLELLAHRWLAGHLPAKAG